MRVKDDKKGLEKLLRLSVMGTALIIVVYSIYYYSNAYKYSSTNLFNADAEADIEIKHLNDFSNFEAKSNNVLFTNNQAVALLEGSGGWIAENAANSEKPFYNSRTTTALSGLTTEGFQDEFFNALKKKYHNTPPVKISSEDGISVRSIQFEHYVFPYHAMINWREEAQYKCFRFYSDSLDGALIVGTNGFKWQSGLHGEYIKVVNANQDDSALQKLLIADAESKIDLVKMPVVDFDVVFSDAEQIGKTFKNYADKSQVIESVGELKILIGPSLKQNEAYQIDETGKTILEIKPPFFVELGKVENDKPYFFALITNEKLLLK